MSQLLTQLRKQLSGEEERLVKETRTMGEALHAKELELADVRTALRGIGKPKPEPAATKPQPKQTGRKRKRKQSPVIGPPVTDEQIRDWMIMVDSFSARSMAEHFKRSLSWADKKIKVFARKGMLQLVEEFQPGRGNRPNVFAYDANIPATVRSNGGNGSGRSNGAGPVAGTSAGRGKRMTQSRDIQPLLDIAKSEGFIVRGKRSGHIHVENPDTGESRKVPGTPSDHRAANNARTRLRQIGVPV